jgi:SAM-dependent methyltransferase
MPAAPAPTGNPNSYQLEDHRARSNDLYANTKYEILLEYLDGSAPLHLLNVGCGSGELSFLLANAGHHVIGIDPGFEYIRMAEESARRLGAARCSFAVSTIAEFETDAPLDGLVATDVLEHIQDDRRAFQKMVSLVRPGGPILITVPAGPWLYGFHDEELGHYRRYSVKSLRQVVEGFCHVEEIRYFGFTLVPISYLYSRLLRRPYPVAETGDSEQKPFVARTLRVLLALDRSLKAPLGTSVIMKAVRS